MTAELRWEGVRNLRDAGGHRTTDGRRMRTGVVYRSGHLGAATDADVAALAALGIAVVVDLRTPSDLAIDGENRMPDRVVHLRLGMDDPARSGQIRQLMHHGTPADVAVTFPPGRAYESMLNTAEALVRSPDRRRQYAALARAVVDAGGRPLLVHCSAGKDRAGWGAALLQLSAGVERDAVLADYLESNNDQPASKARLTALAEAGGDPSLLEPFFVVRPEYLERSFATVDGEFGGIDGYLRDGLGLTTDEVATLRALLVEG